MAHTQESRDLPTGSMACIIGVASTTASGLAAASRAPRGTRATRAAPRLGVRRAGGFAAGDRVVACTAKRASLRAGAAVTPLAAIAEPDANAKAASLRPRKHAGQADEFMKLAAAGHNLIPLYRRLFTISSRPSSRTGASSRRTSATRPASFSSPSWAALRPVVSRSWVPGPTWR